MSVHAWWIIVIFILGVLSSIGIISFDFLDKMGTLTHYLLIVIIIVLFFILSHVEKIYLLLKNTEENAEHKRMRDERLERTSTEDLYTPSEVSVSDRLAVSDRHTVEEMSNVFIRWISVAVKTLLVIGSLLILAWLIAILLD
jgi:hypothetical protein|tara:strand:+ start:24 stop:449 length:426 start_codon:yes stop_codon:yes gene_type:complete